MCASVLTVPLIRALSLQLQAIHGAVPEHPLSAPSPASLALPGLHWLLLEGGLPGALGGSSWPGVTQITSASALPCQFVPAVALLEAVISAAYSMKTHISDTPFLQA